MKGTGVTKASARVTVEGGGLVQPPSLKDGSSKGLALCITGGSLGGHLAGELLAQQQLLKWCFPKYVPAIPCFSKF